MTLLTIFLINILSILAYIGAIHLLREKRSMWNYVNGKIKLRE